MIARLAFSAATDEVPDLLLIDEVLSVGDAEFAQKSRTRMLKIVNSGTTVVLVSHDLNTVAELANRVLWLEHGELKMIGEPKDVIAAYQKSEI
jgi:ABC-type polysaccharide/polyol phosphate transport system ATPase subunit